MVLIQNKKNKNIFRASYFKYYNAYVDNMGCLHSPESIEKVSFKKENNG